MDKVIIKSDYSRRYPDPLNQNMEGDPFNIEHHILVSKAIDVPSGIPDAPNPRPQRIDFSIYKEVRNSLDNVDDLSFHLKNKGITILAHKVEYSPDKKVATVYFGSGDGMADGAHTYQIILAAQDEASCPEGQYVKFEVITGVPTDMAVDITGGLNTAVQVQPKSLANLKKEFDWIKENLKDMPYADNIAYEENVNKDYDIRDILSFLTLFNVNKFVPPSHPKAAYVSKAGCLNSYLNDQEAFKMLNPLLKNILYLHDYIHLQGRKRYNAEKGGSAGAMTGLYKGRKRGKFKFVFMEKEGDYKLHDGALYPIFGAMRFLVEQKPGELVYSWKLGSFDKVKKFFDEVAPELIQKTYNTSVKYGRKPNPVGKDDNLWDHLYQTVEVHFMRRG